MTEKIVLADSANGFDSDFEQVLGLFNVDVVCFRDGMRNGCVTVKVSCGDFWVTIIPTRGMSLHQAGFDGDESQTFGWNSPVRGPVHPAFVPVHEPSGLGWLDGFDELFVRCGLNSNGAPEFDDQGRLVYPLHGRIGNTPAYEVILEFDESSQELSVSGKIRETRFHFAKWELQVEYKFKAGESKVEVNDRITNIGGTPNHFQLLYHYNLGSPLLQAGGNIDVAAEQVVPRNEYSAESIQQWQHVEEAQAGRGETVYFFRPKSDADGQSLAVLSNATKTCASAIRYSTESLPCFSLWKNFADHNDGYVIGLEPATNYPNTRRFEEKQGRVVEVAAGESKMLSLELIFANSSESVAGLVDECNKVLADSGPIICPDPLADWCE